MMKTMPGIEFNQGIPEDIDEPDYLDVSQRNLIVLDDFIAQSGTDKRIADLFTKVVIFLLRWENKMQTCILCHQIAQCNTKLYKLLKPAK